MTPTDALGIAQRPRPAVSSSHIRRELETRILSGEWPPGHRIMSEHDLMRQYGCARMTVNKALAALAEAGLIVRHRRTGSFVAEPHGERAMMEIQDLGREAALRGQRYTHRVVLRSVRALVEDEARLLGAAPGAEVLHLRVVHRLEDVAACHEDRLIFLAQAPQALDEAFASVPPGPWLLRNIPWNDAQHIIQAAPADTTMARCLAIAPGDPLLVLERRTWHRGGMVTRVVLTYPGARQRFTGWFSPGGAEAFAKDILF